MAATQAAGGTAVLVVWHLGGDKPARQMYIRGAPLHFNINGFRIGSLQVLPFYKFIYIGVMVHILLAISSFFAM